MFTLKVTLNSCAHAQSTCHEYHYSCIAGNGNGVRGSVVFWCSKNLRTASTGKLFLPCYDASCTIIGGGPETINLPETQFVCTVMCRNVVEKQQNDDRSRTILRLTQSQLTRSPG